MTAVGTAWRRWRAIAHRAAQVQSHVLLFLLYFIILVPTAAARRALTRRRLPAAGWVPMLPPPRDHDEARRQF